jgi:hypothetical protein
MSVKQYAAEFLRLSRDAPLLISDEEAKIKRFRDGLSPRILERIIFLKVANYAEMVHTATMAEKGIRNTTVDYMNRKRSTSTGTLPPLPPSKKHATSSSTEPYARKGTSASQGSTSHPRCNKCGKPHAGECRMGTGACFKCGRTGHFARECLQTSASRGHGSQASINQPRQTTPARVFALTPENNCPC